MLVQYVKNLSMIVKNNDADQTVLMCRLIHTSFINLIAQRTKLRSHGFL